MSEAKDAVAEAMALNKRLAAKLLVRKQELEAEQAAGPTDVRAGALADELARVAADYRGALAELAELRKLGAAAEHGAASVIGADLAGDPVLQTYEERALDAARAHIAELEAQASLGEVGEPAPVKEPLTRKQSDDEARAEFEALRAKRSAPPKKTL